MLFELPGRDGVLDRNSDTNPAVKGLYKRRCLRAVPRAAPKLVLVKCKEILKAPV